MPGKFFEDLTVGEVFRHATGRTISEADNQVFCGMTMNPQPLHLDAHFASQTPFGQQLVNGILTMGLVVGLTVSELTDGTIVANLSYERVSHPAPVYHGDTVYAETEVLDKRPSKSNPSRGIVRLRHRGRNQHGDVVVELERTVMFLRRDAS